MIGSIWLHQLQRRLFGLRPFAAPQRRSPRLQQESRPFRLQLEGLEERVMPSVSIPDGDVPALIAAINAANSGGDNTIDLATNGTYTLTNVINPGGNGLPDITAANLAINGNGAAIQRSQAAGTPSFRIFEIGPGSTTTLNNLTIAGGNSNGSVSGGGGGILDLGTLSLNNSTVSGNTVTAGGGGGVYVTGTLNLNNSTVSGNSASFGGAVGDAGTLSILNSTIANNNADSGYGISVSRGATANIEDSTIAFNSLPDTPSASGGIDNVGTVTLINSIVAHNTDNAGIRDISSDGILNATNTLIQNLAPGTVINGTNVNNILGQDPLLGPLEKNGGPTETMSIPATSPSPALGAGDPALLPQGLTTDQRGVGFTRLVDGKLDLGAFQVQAGQINFSPVSVFFSFANQNVSLSATITAPGFSSVNGGSGIGGSVTFTVLGQTLTAPVVNGTANTTLTIPGGTPPGTYPVSIVYNGFSDLRGSSTTSTLTIEPLSTSVSSVSNVTLPFTSADPPITLSAVVAAGGSGVNVGQVQFVVTNSSGGQVGQTVTANVSNGQASTVFDVPAATPLGNYTITANYMDPAGNLTSSSSTGTLTVVTSSTMVVINNVNIVYGLFSAQETLTAVVFNALGQVVNEGFVTFTDSGQTATVPLVNSLATVTLTIPIFFENPYNNTIAVSYASGTNIFTSSTSQYTLQQTVMNYLFQVIAFLEWYMQNFPSNTTGHK